MSEHHGFPVFSNDEGAQKVFVPVKRFVCKGVQEPHDHPHVSLTMGTDHSVICPYCSTVFVFKEGAALPSSFVSQKDAHER